MFATFGFQTFAQWTHSGPEGNNLTGKFFEEFNGTLWTKNSRMIYKSIDNGNSWQVAFDLPISFNDIIVRNSFIIASSNNGLYKSIDNGLTWNLINTLNSVIIKQTSTGRLILGSGPYYSDDEGVNWLQSNAPTLIDLRDLAENNGRLIAAGSNGVYISDDNGENWSQSNQGINSADLTPNIWSICSFNNVIYIANGNITGVYKSIDNGNNWVQISSGLSATVAYPFNISIQNNQILRTTNLLGTYSLNTITDTWQLTSLNQTSNVIISNYFDNKYWGTSRDYEGLVKSANSGIIWQNSYSGIKNYTCSRLSVSNYKLFSVAGGVFVYDTLSGAWSRVTPKNFNFAGTLGINNYATFDIKIGSNGKYYVGSNGGVWTSTNNGTTWLQNLTGLPQQTIPTTSCKVNRLYIFGTGGNDTIIAATAAGIYYSTNQAQSFTQATGANNGNFNDIIFTQGKLYAGGNGIYSSSDRGITWTAVNNITSGLITQIAATNTKLWVIANQNAAFTNIGPDTGLHGLLYNGISYNSQFLTGYDSLVFINNGGSGVWKINETQIDATGSNAANIHVATNGNLPFRPIISPTFDTVLWYADYLGSGDLKVFNGKLWLGSSNLSTYYRSMNDFGYNFVVDNNNRKNEPNKIQLYPNPADNKIYFSNLSNNCSIYIYNSLGQCQVTYSKINDSEFDISNLSKGFYFYSIIDDSQNIISNGKFIKE